MSDRYILGPDGKTAVQCEDLMEWAAWFEASGKNRIVRQEKVGDMQVSTVFLAVNHNFAPGGRPLVFETMIFGGPLDGEQDRYSTWEEAEMGHLEMVGKVLNCLIEQKQ